MPELQRAPQTGPQQSPLGPARGSPSAPGPGNGVRQEQLKAQPGPNDILFAHQSKGAGYETAQANGYARGGVATSEALAKQDASRIQGMAPVFEAVGKKYGLPPALLAAIASRETRGGVSSLLKPSGYSALDGYGFGVMQVDYRYHKPKGGPRSVEHVEQAAQILKATLAEVKERMPNLTPDQQLQVAVAGYNAGPTGAITGAQHGNSDRFSAGHDYGNDTWARARALAPLVGGKPAPKADPKPDAISAAVVSPAPSPAPADPDGLETQLKGPAGPEEHAPTAPTGGPAVAPAPAGQRQSIAEILAELRAMREQVGSGTAPTGPAPKPYLTELLATAPLPKTPSGGGPGWDAVQEKAATLSAQSGLAPKAPDPVAPPPIDLGSLDARIAALRAKVASGKADGVLDEAHAIAERARELARSGPGQAGALQAIASEAGDLYQAGARLKQAAVGALGVGEKGRRDMARLAAAASTPWYSRPHGKCYAAVAGFGPDAYMNEAGGRWKQLADRIPSSHGMWAVSFAHWLQETRNGQQAAAELGFVIRESDGKTRLGDYLAAHPELKGAVVVIPFGQEGTASQEWNAAAHYGDRKWGAGVGDISVVTSISGKGATYMADGPIAHNNATMWWVVYPK